MTLPQGPLGNYIARKGISDHTRIYNPMNCIFLVVPLQVEFTKYETGPSTILEGTSGLVP